MFAQSIAPDYFSGVFQQQGQGLKRLLLQLDEVALLAQFARLKIEFEHPEAVARRLSVLGGHSGSGAAWNHDTAGEALQPNSDKPVKH